MIKNLAQIESLREGGKRLSLVLEELVKMVKPGVTTGELDAHAQARMAELGGEPSFLGYRITSTSTAYNSAVCTSINEEVIHAPAVPSRAVAEGDLLKLDIGLRYQGLCTDMAVTVPVGEVSEVDRKLIEVTRASLMEGLARVRPGGWVSDIGRAVDKFVRRAGFTTVKDFCGHGVGEHVHEEPSVPNYFDPELLPVELRPGLVIAIEPMVNVGGEEVDMHEDGWTVLTTDRSRSAHFEVTVVVTENGHEVVTPLPV